MRKSVFLGVTLAVQAYAYSWPWQADVGSMQYTFSQACKASHYTAYETYDKPIDFRTSPLDPLDGPKLNPMNKTAGEQWEFDGIDETGKAGLVIGFYRDPNYAILGTGNFRVSLDLLTNGTIYSQDHHVTHSIVEECESGITGTWFTSDEVRYTFEVTNDYKHARITVRTPKITGTFEIHSSAPARYPDGSVYPNEHARTAAAPFFYWVQPIPTGCISVDLNVEGTSVQWKGLGGHE